MTIFHDRFAQGLQEDNPWWDTGKIGQELPSFKRSDYQHYAQELDSARVCVMIGPRRVGKTTLIHQLIEYLLNEKKVDPKTILFASLERYYFAFLPDGSESSLDTALQFFIERVYQKPLANAEQMLYFFIDEAHYDPKWARILKQLVDQKRNVHVIASGSSAVALDRDLESGVGRFKRYQMVTMKLRDVIRKRYPHYETQIDTISRTLRDSFKESCSQKSHKPYETAIKNLAIDPDILACIKSSLDDYLLRGGYPEFYSGNKNWKDISRDYQNNVFDVILQKDVVRAFEIRLPEKLRRMMILLAQETSRPLARSKIAKNLGFNNEKTVDEYIEALTQAFLIRTSAKFKLQGFPSSSPKKFYAADTGLRNAIIGVQERGLQNNERGQLLETAVFNHTLRLAFHIDHEIRNQGYYWEDGEEERDIIMDLRKTYDVVLPIEVKNGHCGDEDIRKIKGTMSKLKSPFGIVICEGREGTKDTVLTIPAWIFMLSC